MRGPLSSIREPREDGAAAIWRGWDKGLDFEHCLEVDNEKALGIPWGRLDQWAQECDPNAEAVYGWFSQAHLGKSGYFEFSFTSARMAVLFKLSFL